MGLDTSHDAWHGAYSAFMRWRRMLAEVAGLPPLDLMEGFYANEGVLNNPFWMSYRDDQSKGFAHSESIWARLPIKWSALKPDALHILLHHSDCEGEIRWQDCKPIAASLKKLLPLMPDADAGGHIGQWKPKTKQFIDGLMAAHKAKENLNFH